MEVLNLKDIPKFDDDVSLSFTFHTSFIDDNRLYLKKSELDNMEKSEENKNIDKFYSYDFSVELIFKNNEA